MRPRTYSLLFPLAMTLAAGLAFVWPAAADDWLPISQEELQMKDSPGNPGAHAIYLYREEYVDDTTSFRSFYYRIKILDEVGKGYADVVIHFSHDLFNVGEIRARTILPDGRIVNWNGKVFEQTVVKGQGIKYLAKTFVIPEAQVGSIIEYKYKANWDRRLLLPTNWTIQEELFTRRARFSLKRSRAPVSLRWINIRVPGNKYAKEEAGLIQLEL